MSIASVVSVVCALIIIGVFLVIAINVNYITKEIEGSLEIKVYVEDDLSEAQMYAVETALNGNDLVSSVSFESKSAALDNFRESFGDKSYLLSGYEGTTNPLPASYIVKLDDSQKIKEFTSFAKNLEGVKDVVYGEDVVQNLLSFSKFTSIVSIVIFLVLSCVSIFIIFNTIKLTVFARRNDITIMKYIGATDWYIRCPFLIEGSLLGLLGSTTSLLVIRTIYYFIIGYVQGSVITLPMGTTLASPSAVLSQISIYFILYGIAIGAIGSSFSLRKFLNV